MKKAKKNNRISFGQILLGIVVLVMAGGLVLNYVALNEVSAEVNSATKEYERLVSQNESMEREVEQTVSASNMDELAQKLDMVKVDPHQIQYFDVVEADSMSTTLDEDKQNGLLDNIVYSFNILVEYLK